MSLFKKPKKNIRRRIVGENDDEEENENLDKGVESKGVEENTTSQISKNAGKTKEKKKEKQRKQTLLSFEEDLNEGDDGEVFQVKKSNHSKKIMKLLDRERKKKKEDKDTDSTPVIIEVPLKKSSNAHILNGREAEFAGHTISDDEEHEDEASKQRKHIFNQPDVKLLLQSGRIPDAAMIHAARKRRQLAREMGGDYIPVDDTKRYDADKSRLVREDDNDVSDDEGEDGNVDGERIKFSVPNASADRERRREAIFAAQEAGSEESDRGYDEELEKWESQQIRKGVTGAQITAVQQGTIFGSHTGVPSHEAHEVNTVVLASPLTASLSGPTNYNTSDRSLATEVAISRLAAQSGEKVTPEGVKRRLGERLASLKEVSRRHEADKEKVVEEVATLQKEAGDREALAPSLARRFRFYQELRGYVTDLVECLDEKVSIIEGVESRMHTSVWRKRRDELISRRRQDVRDQAKELAPIVSNRVTSGMRGNPEEEEARVRRAAEREGRRSRRRRGRQMAARSSTAVGVVAPLKHYEGMSSDDEQTELEVVAYRKQKELIEGDGHKIFEDVVEEFCSVRGVLGRWEHWRLEEENSYREAYASLCLPRVLAPILRLNLLSWNPIVIQDDSSGTGPCGFEGRKWFDLLLMYGLRETETEDSLRNDPDLKLVSLVVEKVILPKLSQLVECSWDPMSTSQTLRLVRIVAKIVEEYPTVTPYIPPSSTNNSCASLPSSARPLRTLLSGIVDRLREAVDNDVFIPIHPKHVMDAKGGAMGTFFQRQFWSAVKLLRNVVAWAGIISDSILGDLALHSILNRYLLAALRTCPDPIDAVSKCRMIVSSLPRWWLCVGLSVNAKDKGDEVNPQLKMFASQLVVLRQSLDAASPTGREAADEVASILKLLGTKETKKT